MNCISHSCFLVIKTIFLCKTFCLGNHIYLMYAFVMLSFVSGVWDVYIDVVHKLLLDVTLFFLVL